MEDLEVFLGSEIPRSLSLPDPTPKQDEQHRGQKPGVDASDDAENDEEESAQLLKEAQGLKQILTSQLNDLAGATAGGVPQLKRHVWLSPAESERASQSLSPMFNKARKGLEKLLEETLTLEVALERKTEPHVMALLLP